MDIGKAAVRGNVPLRQIGGAQELLGMFDPQPEEVLVRRETEVLTEDDAEPGG